MIHTLKRTPTTEMEVTSIRLERELKERLKEISGHQGYQALIREVLWKYVQQKSGDYRHRFTADDIRATVAATANTEERCGITGKVIEPKPHQEFDSTFGVIVLIHHGEITLKQKIKQPLTSWIRKGLFTMSAWLS